MSTETDKGVLQQHADRLEKDDAYRESHLTPPPAIGANPDITVPGSDDAIEAAIVGAERKPDDEAAQAHAEAVLNGEDEAEPDEDQGAEFDKLTGKALDDAAAAADIDGRSTMSADEKRQALRDQA